jgi:hypothetical protein
VSQSWEGHTAATQLFQERAQAFMRAVKPSPRPPSRLADANLSTADHAATLHGLGFITRLAHPLGVGSHGIEPALPWDTWHAVDDTTRDPGVARGHADRAPRGRVV